MIQPSSRQKEVKIPFGIYIKTCRRDFHLAKSLIQSLRKFAPDVPIVIIPDDGYRKSSIWGVSAMNSDTPLLQELKGFMKKLWIFAGPFERFIYLDADMLALKPLDGLLSLVRSAKPPFCFVNQPSWMHNFGEAPEEERTETLAQHVGNVRLWNEFHNGPCFDGFVPFNSGFIATTRDSWPIDKIEATYAAQQFFLKARGLTPLGKNVGDMRADQGLLNYMAATSGLEVTYLHEVYTWGGKPIPPPTSDKLTHLLVHWAGCPRPQPFAYKHIPAGNEWWINFLAFHRPTAHWPNLVLDTADYQSRLLIFRARQYLKRQFRIT